MNWLEVQKDILDNRELIAEIEVETITLTRLGGYKATPYSLDLDLFTEPTAKSLKGVWRWWARLAIVGAFSGKIDYEKATKKLNGVFGSTKMSSLFRLEVRDVKFSEGYRERITKLTNMVDDFYSRVKDFLTSEEPQLKEKLPPGTSISISLNPSDLNITIRLGKAREVARLADIKNYVDRQIKVGSLGKFFVESRLSEEKHRIRVTLKLNDEIDKFSKIPRIKLLLMPRGNEKDEFQKSDIDSKQTEKYLERVKEELAMLISKGLRFKILLHGTKESEKLNFAISSLLLALIFGGIGSITKRAFGSLRLLTFKFREGLEIDEEIQRFVGKLTNEKLLDRSELKMMLEKLRDIAVDYAKKVCKIDGAEEPCIPAVPSLNNMRIEIIECSALDLVKIGNAFVKQHWKPPGSPAQQGRDLHTWILGLPRWQQNTGYAVTEIKKHRVLDVSELEKLMVDPKRRLSAVGARCFKIGHKNFIILFGLPSRDWPLKGLLHIRKVGSQRVDVKPIEDIEIRQRPNLKGDSLQDVFDVAFSEVKKRVC